MHKLNSIKQILMILLISGAQGACNNGDNRAVNSPSPHNLNVAEDTVDKDVLLGQGIMGRTFVVTPSKVIEMAANVTAPSIIGDQVASRISFSHTIDKSITANDLGIKGSINGAISNFKGSLAGEYSTATADSNTSISTDYAAIFAGQYTYDQATHDFVLSKNGIALYNSNKDEFYRQFGDSFVSSVRAGISVFANLKFVFQDSTTKSKIAANVDFSSDPVKIAGDIINNDSKNASKVKVQVYISQFGGDVSTANKVFAAGNGQAIGKTGESQNVYLFECSLTNFEACNVFLRNVNAYIAGDYIFSVSDTQNGALQLTQQVNKYLKTGKVTLDDLSKLYRFGPAATNVNSLGENIGGGNQVTEYKYTPYELLAKAEEPRIEQYSFPDAVVQMQKNLAKDYVEANNNLIFLNAYSNLLSSAPLSDSTWLDSMTQLKNNYEQFINQNLTKDTELLTACYTPNSKSSENCNRYFITFDAEYSMNTIAIAKYNVAYKSTNSSGHEFYLLPADSAISSEPHKEFVSWSDNKSSYTPNGVDYLIDNGEISFDGVASSIPYLGAYNSQYIFAPKAEGITCSATNNSIICNNPKNKLDKNTLQAYKILDDGSRDENAPVAGLFIGGTFNKVNNPMKPII